MNPKTTKLRDAISLALVISATTTGAAFAQEATTTLDKVEVTGSRIKRTDVETSQPVFSLTREDIQAQGLTSIGDVIQNLTSNGTALNTTYNNGTKEVPTLLYEPVLIDKDNYTLLIERGFYTEDDLK